MRHNFNEKKTEWSARDGKEIPVIITPKFEEAKSKAIEIIDSKKYGLSDGDFWILMNQTKTGNMAYSGLIISHNGCLKINDCLDSKFKPSCVFHDTAGYKGELVFHYQNDEQGIYEVGEVSDKNCKNEYPYAMAYKRMFDRVVLKLSKLAYAGIYSDSESDEFTQQLEATAIPKKATKCRRCKKEITDDVLSFSMCKYKMPLCEDCQRAYDEYAAKKIEPNEAARAWEISEK